MLDRSYPQAELTAVPAVLLDAFLAERQLSDDDNLAGKLDERETQQIYATFEGAQRRALACGGLRGHDCQAAAILVGLQELDGLLDGHLTVGGASGFQRKLDEDELGALRLVRKLLVDLLPWHFSNGAGALLPMADNLGLVWKRGWS
ncbi:hypothetical protein DAH66_06350 [Sphingomonas koreensis]|uniref:Uncharacterized protein n=1 Tax=Sphingomonas koreensis TaxID=93064 RepID=A0A430G6D3_9SPHN|nr:hypothetical protein [Sphingomonas koreensis]RSY88069.1 hypothetical protein DAH66_06350 [Sphingomonas koreensis]